METLFLILKGAEIIGTIAANSRESVATIRDLIKKDATLELRAIRAQAIATAEETEALINAHLEGK